MINAVTDARIGIGTDIIGNITTDMMTDAVMTDTGIGVVTNSMTDAMVDTMTDVKIDM